MNKKDLIKMIAGVLIGATGGYLYYYFIGCRTGSCPITSNPYFSILFGSIIGLIITMPDSKNSKKDMNKKGAR